jgi:hypothetical protein
MDTALDAGAAAPANETVVSDVIDTSAATVTPVVEAQPEPSLEDSLKAVWDKHNPSRAPDGKFAPKDSETPEIAAGAESDTAKPEPAGQPETAKIEPAQPAIDAPYSWPAEAKAKWASVPPELQSIVSKRETEAQQAISRLGNDKVTLERQVKAYEPINQLLQARQQDFARRGIAPAQAFAALLNAQDMLEADPVNGLTQLGLSFGIDLRGVFSGQQQQAGVDPQVVQLTNTVARLQQQIAQTQSTVAQRETAEQARLREAEQAQATQLSDTIHDFSKDKLYFEDVRPLMATLLSGGQAKTLDEAYDMAVNANPTIRQRIQSDQRKADEDKRTAEAKAKADAARKAASVNVKSALSSPNPKTMEDDMRDVYRRLNA